MFGTDFPYDAEGGAILVRETLRALDELLDRFQRAFQLRGQGDDARDLRVGPGADFGDIDLA